MVAQSKVKRQSLKKFVDFSWNHTPEQYIPVDEKNFAEKKKSWWLTPDRKIIYTTTLCITPSLSFLPYEHKVRLTEDGFSLVDFVFKSQEHHITVMKFRVKKRKAFKRYITVDSNFLMYIKSEREKFGKVYLNVLRDQNGIAIPKMKKIEEDKKHMVGAERNAAEGRVSKDRAITNNSENNNISFKEIPSENMDTICNKMKHLKLKRSFSVDTNFIKQSNSNDDKENSDLNNNFNFKIMKDDLIKNKTQQNEVDNEKYSLSPRRVSLKKIQRIKLRSFDEKAGYENEDCLNLSVAYSNFSVVQRR